MIPRPLYLDKIRPYLGTSVIKVLTGVRRCGKSTLLGMVADELTAAGQPRQVLRLDFESAQLSHVQDSNDLVAHVLSRIDPSRPVALLFDEVQEVDGWERAVRSLSKDLDADIYITGSNARMLSSELATLLTGRYVTIEVHPLSFAEFVTGLRATRSDASDREAFRAYVELGGMPFLHEVRFEREASLQYLRDVYSTILLHDVVRHASIRNVNLLERLLRYVIGEVGHPFSAKSISQYLKSEGRGASIETVQSYLDAAEQAFLIYRSLRQGAAGKALLKSNEKHYCVDLGFRSALGFRNVDNIDQALENIVYLELVRRGYEVYTGRVGKTEIDFVAERNGGREYYQVSYRMDAPSTQSREFAPLLATGDAYPKRVLTLDEFAPSYRGIESVDLVAWLLGT